MGLVGPGHEGAPGVEQGLGHGPRAVDEDGHRRAGVDGRDRDLLGQDIPPGPARAPRPGGPFSSSGSAGRSKTPAWISSTSSFGRPVGHDGQLAERLQGLGAEGIDDVLGGHHHVGLQGDERLEVGVGVLQHLDVAGVVVDPDEADVGDGGRRGDGHDAEGERVGQQVLLAQQEDGEWASVSASPACPAGAVVPVDSSSSAALSRAGGQDRHRPGADEERPSADLVLHALLLCRLPYDQMVGMPSSPGAMRLA